MNQFSKFVNEDRTALVKGDGGSYIVEMYISDTLTETKAFTEHTLRIVENFAKNWTESKE
jgi:hypothetical protein